MKKNYEFPVVKVVSVKPRKVIAQSCGVNERKEFSAWGEMQ